MHAVAKGRLNRRQILDLLTEKPQAFTVKQLAEYLKIEESSIRVHCDHLAGLGLVIETRIYKHNRRRKGIIAYKICN